MIGVKAKVWLRPLKGWGVCLCVWVGGGGGGGSHVFVFALMSRQLKQVCADLLISQYCLVDICELS